MSGASSKSKVQAATWALARNRPGLPAALKAGIERLSGVSLKQVRVHYNSAQPAQLNALTYTEGRAIHVARGQEKHLPHQAWHVVQPKKQGRVRPTLQARGRAINDDNLLEKEADVMGAAALVPREKAKSSRSGPSKKIRGRTS